MPVSLLFASLLDGGQLAKVAGCTMVGFWLGVAFIVTRRPRNPSGADLVFIRYGYLPLVAMGTACAVMVHG